MHEGATAGEGNAEEWLGAVPSSLAPSSVAPAAVQRLRFRYRKVGPARFIGTRELTTVLARAARRARLPVAFSRGHHPLPRLSFGPALPLGASSEDELFDLDLTARVEAPEALTRLGSELPEGLALLGAVEIPRSARSIDESVAGFRWQVDLGELPERPAPGAVAAAVSRFREGGPLPVSKTGKGRERLVDGRSALTALEQPGPERLVLEIAVGRDGTLRPNAVVGALLGLDATTLPALRVHKLETRFRPAADPAGVTTSS
jgi:radical SAM-linked protein